MEKGSWISPQIINKKAFHIGEVGSLVVQW